MIEVLGIDGYVHNVTTQYIKEVVGVTATTCDIHMTESTTLPVDEPREDVINKIRNVMSFYIPPQPQE